jgi:hypothetical protein
LKSTEAADENGTLFCPRQKTASVTGGASGIRRTASLRLASDGALPPR